MSIQYRAIKTIGGIDFDIAKSGLQKSIRRGREDHALAFLADIEQFANVTKVDADGKVITLADGESRHDCQGRNSVLHLAEKDARAIKTIRSNMVNRLKICAIEDVLDPRATINAANCIRDWEASDRRDYESIARAVIILCRAKKMRLISDNKVFMHADTAILRFPEYADLLGEALPTQSVDIYAQFRKELLARSKKVLFLFAKIRDMPRHSTRVWKIIHDSCAVDNELLSAVEWMYKSIPAANKERWLFIYYVLLVSVYNVQTEQFTCLPDIPLYAKQNVGYDPAAVQEILRTTDYIVDKHTATGRARGKTTRDFVIEGSRCENEDLRYFDSRLRDIYVRERNGVQVEKFDSSLLQRAKLINIVTAFDIEIENIDFREFEGCPIAQLRTAKYKKYTYISGSNIYKGPFRGSEIAFKTALVHHAIFNILHPEARLDFAIVRDGEYLCDAGQYYLRLESLGDYARLKTKMRESKIDRVMPVAERGSYVLRVSEIEAPPENVIRVALQHLYYRFLFGIGDAGFFNVLTNHEMTRVAGTDFEEYAGMKTACTRLELLLKKRPTQEEYARYDRGTYSIVPINIDLLTTRFPEIENFINLSAVRARAEIFARL